MARRAPARASVVRRLRSVRFPLRSIEVSSEILVRRVAHGLRHIPLRALNGYVEVGLARGGGFEVDRQVVGVVALDDIGSVLQIDDVEAVDWVRRADDMGATHD